MIGNLSHRHRRVHPWLPAARRWLAACIALWSAAAMAQDAGLVTQLQGQATYRAEGAAAGKVVPLMKIRTGDRITLEAGASLKLLYFKTATVEAWSGPARMTVGDGASEQGSGQMTSTALPAPARATVELNRLAGLNRIGAVVVRGITPPEADIKQAHERYDTWRAQAAPDDLLPDFYLYSVYKQYKRKAEMQALAADMLKRAPGSEEAQALARQAGAQ